MGQRRYLKEIRKYFALTENGKAAYQNLWDAAKTVIREKSIAWNFYIREKKMSQINDLLFSLRKLVKEKQIKHKVSRTNEIIKIRWAIHKIEDKNN